MRPELHLWFISNISCCPRNCPKRGGLQYCNGLPYITAWTRIWPPCWYQHGPTGTIRHFSSRSSGIRSCQSNPLPSLISSGFQRPCWERERERDARWDRDLLYPTASTALNFQSNKLLKAKSLKNSKHLLRDKTQFHVCAEYWEFFLLNGRCLLFVRRRQQYPKMIRTLATLTELPRNR